MTSATKSVLAGGCQCGAVRFALSAPPVKVSICHCRMCQKAAGAPFASFAEIERADFAWTRGKPSAFRSSSLAERDFCAACGTPLSFRRVDGPKIEIMTGAFDRPDRPCLCSRCLGKPINAISVMVRVLAADDAAQLVRPVVLQRGLARQVGDADYPAEPGFGAELPGRHQPVRTVERTGHDLDFGAVDPAKA